MFQMLHCDNMQKLGVRKNETIAMETQTDGIDVPKPQSLSGGDFVSNKSRVSLNYDESKSSIESDCKSSGEQQQDGNNSEGKTSKKTTKSNMSTQLKVEMSRYKQELRDYNDTTRHLEKKYRRINTELNEMQLKHEKFLAKRKSKNKSQEDRGDDDEARSFTSIECTSLPSSEYSLKAKYTKVFHRDESLQSPHSMEISSPLPQVKRSNQQCDHHIIVAGANKLNKKKHLFGAPYIGDMGALRTRAPSSLNFKNQRFRRKFIEYERNDVLSEPNLNVAQTAGLKNIYKTLKSIMENQHEEHKSKSCKSFISDQSEHINAIDVIQLQNILTNLQTEQSKSHILIQQQQKCLQDYHNRSLEAQQLVQSQKNEINNLQHNNAKLESDFTAGIEQLRSKIDSKLREVSLLPKMIRDEREKNDKECRDSKTLSERLRGMQQEAAQLRIKLEDISKRKASALVRLRSAERDLKIFKNHNAALKNEKKRLTDELKKVKDQLELSQNSNKRSISRQREQFEKQRRELQKRVYELEMKLNRSQKSTTGIIQERDKVIAELQSQLNTLVHNFEVSQKHIRVLRRHIYSMPSGSPNLSMNNGRMHRT